MADDDDATTPRGFAGLLIFAWGVLGPCALLAAAVFRLLPLALEPLVRQLLSPFQMTLYVGFILFNAYAEGYRGFQRGFSPRVVARAAHLARNPTPLHALLAPLYTVGFIHSTLKRKLVSGLLTLFVVLAVVLVRRLDQPWRGIIDAGVVVGLGWGLASTIALAIHACRGRLLPSRSLDLPPAATGTV